MESNNTNKYEKTELQTWMAKLSTFKGEEVRKKNKTLTVLKLLIQARYEFASGY